MSLLTPPNFIDKWLTRFADNTTGAINEAAMREFAQDLNDSALSGKLGITGPIYAGISSGSALGFSAGWLGFNASRNEDSTGWIFYTDSIHNGGMLIFGDIFKGGRYVVVPTTDPGTANQVLTDAQVAALARNFDGSLPTPTQPTGVTFSTAPGTPTITSASITETASTVSDNGTPVIIPSSTLPFSLAAAGKHRYDAIVANYGGTPAYERNAGTEVLTSEAAPTPSIPADRLFVRFIEVTDGEAREALSEYEPKLPAAGAPQTGFGLFWDGSKKVWAPLVATAGGTTTGAMQYRGSDGKVTGTDLLKWDEQNRIMQLGATGQPGKWEVIASESVLEAQDGQPLQILINTDLETAFVISDKTTGKLFLKARTKTNNEAIVAVENFDTDALIGAPYKVRQGQITTTTAAKTYLRKPNSADDIVITLPFDGNAVMITANIMGVTATGTEAITIRLEATARRSAGVVSIVGAQTLTVKETIVQGATAAIEANATNDGIKISVTPASSAISKEYTWVMYTQYMKL